VGRLKEDEEMAAFVCGKCGNRLNSEEDFVFHMTAFHGNSPNEVKRAIYDFGQKEKGDDFVFRDENPTEEFKQVDGKICTTLVPSSIMWAIGRIRTHFTKVVKKYPDPQSWRKAPMQHYIEATDRHWLAAREDPHAINEESGMPHLWHVATNLAFIIEMIGVDIP
jgi:hypothetical protein